MIVDGQGRGAIVGGAAGGGRPGTDELVLVNMGGEGVTEGERGRQENSDEDLGRDSPGSVHCRKSPPHVWEAGS